MARERLGNHTDCFKAEDFLKRWNFWSTHSRLEPVIEAAKTIKRNEKGVLQFVDGRITMGIVKGLTNKIKKKMKRAHGFKSFAYMRTVIYLVPGKINILLPIRS